MKKLIFLFLAALAPAAQADIIHLNKGEELNGKILKLDETSVTVEIDGKQQVVERRDIMKIQFVSEYRGKTDPTADERIKELLANPPKAENYPNDGYVDWLSDMQLDIAPDRSYYSTDRSVRYILRERGKSPAAFTSLGYLPSVSTVTLTHAYALNAGKASYLDDISVMDGDTYMSYPAYAGHHTMKFALPNAQVGSVLDYEMVVTNQYRSTDTLFGLMDFRFDEPTGTVAFTVRVPKNLKLLYKENNMPASRQFTTTEENGKTVYTWQLQNQPSYKNEPQTPPFGLYAPSVMVSLADTWENVRDTFAPLLKEKLTLTPEIKTLVKELTAGKKTDTDKVEALYNWVAREIKLQHVPLSTYSYVPKPAAETFGNRSGNALDKPFLLYAMLDEAGLKPELAYAQGKDSIFAPELPNIRQFSTAQVLVTADGRTSVLVPLDDQHRYFELPSWLQGGNALRVLGDTQKPLLLTNPEFSPEQESYEETSAFVLDKKGGITGRISTRMTGDEQADFRSFKDYKKADLDKAMEEEVHSLHPQARLESYRMSNLADLSRDVDYNMDVSIKNYAMKAGDYMILRLPGTQSDASDVSQTERELPFFWYGAQRSAKMITLQLPSGYTVYHLPKGVALEQDGMKYSASYKVNDDTIVFTKEYRRTTTLLPTADYAAYKEFREAMAAFTENWIVLQKD